MADCTLCSITPGDSYTDMREYLDVVLEALVDSVGRSELTLSKSSFIYKGTYFSGRLSRRGLDESMKLAMIGHPGNIIDESSLLFAQMLPDPLPAFG